MDIKDPLQPHQIYGFNQAIIILEELCLLCHRVSKAIRDILVLRHQPNPVMYDRVHYNIEDIGGQWFALGNTPVPLEGVPVVTT